VIDGVNVNSAVVDIYNVFVNSWTTSSLSQARYFLASTALNNLVFFAGGFIDSNTFSSVVDIYNINSGAWTTASLSQARYGLAATTVGTDLVIFAGGMSLSGTSSVVDIYNVTSHTWRNATLSVARYLLAATNVGDVAIFAGGSADTVNPLSVIDVFNHTTGNWSTATLNQARFKLAATSVGNLAIFGGGLNSGGFSNVADVFNTTAAPIVAVASAGLPASTILGITLGLGIGLPTVCLVCCIFFVATRMKAPKSRPEKAEMTSITTEEEGKNYRSPED